MYIVKVREWIKPGIYRDYPVIWYSEADIIKAYEEAKQLSQETGNHYYVIHKD